MAFERVQGVVGAGRNVPARGRTAREDPLIGPDRGGHQSCRDRHLELRGESRSIIVVRNRVCDQPSSGAVTRISRSPDGGRSSFSRSRSLSIACILRRVRFRSTAFPTSREIANAIRVTGSSEGRNCNRNGPLPAFSPSARSRARARRLESPAITRPGERDLSGVGIGSPPDPLGCSCGRGSRASCAACGHSVGKDASSLLPRGTAGSRRRPERSGRAGAVGAVDDDDHGDPT